MFGKHARMNETGRVVRAIVPDGPRESVLVAVLAARNALRRHEFGDEPRAGFCLMGACQDCWVWLADGARVRACTTPVAEGLHVLTQAPEFP